MRLPLLLAAAASIVLAGAAPTQQASAPTFSADRFKSHVAFLADDLLEGRDTGSRGHRIAAAYVASQFTGLGLQPGGDNGGWYEEVPFRSATLAGPASVTITGAGGAKSFDNGNDVFIRPSLAEQQQDVAAPVVFAGYGIDAPDLGIDDYKGLDVRGKIVAILGGTPSGLPGEIASDLGTRKAAMAARHGAIGVVTLLLSPTGRARTGGPAARGGGRPLLGWVGKDGNPENDAPGIRATAILSDSAVEALFAGAPRTLATLRIEAASPAARPKGFALATTLRLQRTSQWTAITSPEVVGILPGSDPKLAGQYVVLMGHLDHLGMRPNARPGEDAIYNGALDNAAGVATMIEAARAFVQSGQRPRRSILFIANTGEEKGLLGADYFANNPTVPKGSIVGVVDLDMPLLLYHFTDVIAFGADHSTVAQTVAKAAASMGIGLEPDPMPEQNIFVRSDHYMFVKQGVPAVFLATGFANGGGDKWHQFLNGAYHHVNDDMSQPIDWASGARFAELNYRISRALADDEQQPLWYRGDYFADTFAPNGPRALRPTAAAAAKRAN